MFGSPLPSKKVIHMNSFVTFIFVIETFKTRTTTSPRFPHYRVLLTCEPSSIYYEFYLFAIERGLTLLHYK